LKFLRIGP
jgi:hypothetical protein